MPRGRLIGLIFLFLAFILAGLIMTDATPWLRGPAPDTSEWHWSYGLRPVLRWWVSLLCCVLLIWVAYWWERKAIGRIWPIILVIGLTLGLQLGIIFADRPNIGAELIDRTLSKDTSGYAAVAGEIDDLNNVLRNFPELMPAFDNEHVRTHPPGLIAFHWLIERAFRALPDLTGSISQPARLWRCTDLWVISRSPATAATLLISALLPVVAAALVPWATYVLARSLCDEKTARWSALFSAAIPALLVFSPTPDQVFALLAVISLWLVSSSIQRKRPLRLVMGGMTLSVMTMLSIGNVAWVVVVLGWAAWIITRLEYRPRSLIIGSILFAVGLVSMWGFYWVGWGVAPWDVIITGLAQHRQLVTVFRSYPLWLLFNPLDFLLFAGVATAVGLTLQSIQTIRSAAERRTKAGPLALILFLTLIALNVSGGTRGEVGRLWLVFMPVSSTVAVDYWMRATKDRSAMLLLLASQLILVLAVGLGWRPIRAVILPVVPPVYPELPHTMTSLGVDLQASERDRITLEAFDITENEINQAIDLTLTWRSDHPTIEPYVVFVHVLDEAGNLVAQQDGWAVDGTWPTTCWDNEELVVDSRSITMPKGSAPGVYTVITGVYNGQTGTRLITLDGGDHIRLGEISFEP